MEKNIKLDDDDPTGFSQNAKPSQIEDFKPVEQRESKKSSRSRRKDRRLNLVF